MRRITLSFMAALAILAVAATTVMADSPHIVGSPSVSSSGNSVTFTASVAGLGNVPSATFTLAGTINVSSRCYTKSNNTPQAANKQETIDVNSTKTFDVRNGRTNASFTVSPISTLKCPGGQHVVIESFTYDLDLVYMGETLYTFSNV
jgi:hypothetical protein